MGGSSTAEIIMMDVDKPSNTIIKSTLHKPNSMLVVDGGLAPLVIAKAPSTSSSAPPAKWRLVPFQNPARSDDLELYHWINTTTIPSSLPYPFAKYDKALDLIMYSDQEYAMLIAPQDTASGWTRQETDYLWGLVEHYDARFPVVYDVYDFISRGMEVVTSSDMNAVPPTPMQHPPQRSMEDLKERYYGVCHALLCHRHPNSVAKFDRYIFDKGREMDRKRQLELLLNRSAEQVREADALFIALKRREMMGLNAAASSPTFVAANSTAAVLHEQQPWSKEHENVVRLLGDHEADEYMYVKSASSLSLNSAVDGVGKAGSSAPKKVRKSSSHRKLSSAHLSASGEGDSLGSSSAMAGIDGEFMLVSGNSALPPEKKGGSRAGRKAGSSTSGDGEGTTRSRGLGSIHVGSARIANSKSSHLAKINVMLHELGLGIKPEMPTEANVTRFMEIRSKVIGVLEMRRGIEKVEGDLRVALSRRQMLAATSSS